MELIERIKEYEASTKVFLDAVAEMDMAKIDSHAEGGWTARQVIHHVADSEAQSYARLRRLLAEPAGSIIQGYDEAAWAQCPELGYQTLSTEHSLNVFKSVRESSASILHLLKETDLEKHGTHSESGRYSLSDWLDIYTRHPREHMQQLLEAINA